MNRIFQKCCRSIVLYLKHHRTSFLPEAIGDAIELAAQVVARASPLPTEKNNNALQIMSQDHDLLFTTSLKETFNCVDQFLAYLLLVCSLLFLPQKASIQLKEEITNYKLKYYIAES